jgi:putative radical SAM enzyme (TIGR03279 family)
VAETPQAPAETDGLGVADVRGPAVSAGLRAGDRIVRLNDEIPVDVLDLEDAAADGALRLTVLREGRSLDLGIPLETGEWHGVSLDHGGLGAAPRTCRNACRFCFVDQVPPGLRPALYVKDDDYRLSFLHGNFTTLGNLDDDDLGRIEDLRLSPLYVSLHAWDDDTRLGLMGRAAAGSRAALERLAAAGLELHLQVVLCPGWNDGPVLAETVARAGALDAVADIGIVPVSLATEGDLRRVSRAEAVVVVDDVARWQAGFRARRGAAVVHAADELHLLAGREPPASDAPDQYENGVGMAAALLEEATGLASETPGRIRSGRRRRASRAAPVAAVRLLSGMLARPIMERAARVLAGATGMTVRPFVVENRLFGAHVTVTGLLGGGDVRTALGETPLEPGEWLLAPRDFLPADLGRTLDDVGEEDLRLVCGGRLVVAETLREGFATLSR